MKFIKILVIFLFILIMYPLDQVISHPGRQDEYGGHVCRTNCEDWGLEYGEYHYHDYVNRPKETSTPTPQPTIKVFKEFNYVPETYNETVPKVITENKVPPKFGLFIFWTLFAVCMALVYASTYMIRKKEEHKEIIDLSESKEVEVLEIIESPTIVVLPPPEKQVSLVGVITKKIYRKRGFFVAKFVTEDQDHHVIVGYYFKKLYLNKQYKLDGVLKVHPKYGMQIEVNRMERII